MKYSIFLILSISASISANAGLFSPNSYEECLGDMVKNAKNNDYQVAQVVCRKQFPSLIKLANKKDTNLSCEDSNNKSIYHVKIKNGFATIEENPKINFETTTFTKELFAFKGKGESNLEKKKIKVYGKIDPIFAKGRFVIEYEDKKQEDFIYEFTCVEN